VLRAHKGGVTGILNGVDYAVWHPRGDTHLRHRYCAQDLRGKSACKADLQHAQGMRVDPLALLMAVVSRLTSQKGLDLLLQVLPQALRNGAQLVVLGQGDKDLEAGFAAAVKAYPGQVTLLRAHDEALAHRLFAAADVLLVPSRFEPCGLTQLYAMAYGALPLVHHVGGLADTVVDVTLESLEDDKATGFAFYRFEAGAIEAALRRAHLLWSRPAQWAQVQQRAMAQRFDWDRAAQAYGALYERALGHRCALATLT
jgi:starch synthase